LTSAIVLAVAIVATINVGLSLKKNNSSLLTLYQSDILASGEGSNNSSTGNNYEHLRGVPKGCTLYKYTNVEGNVKYGSNSYGKGIDTGYTYTGITVAGTVETCPNSGNGCTVYSCKTSNTNP
jgi:hypothetical protein